MPTHIQIGDVSPRIQYAGDGVQIQFTYPFPIFQDADIEVYENTTIQTITTDYTVAGAGSSSGGSVNFVTAPANGATVTLHRQLDIQRTSDFQEAGEFRAKVINDELDVITASVQQVSEKTSRGLHLGPTDDFQTSLEIPDKATRSSKFLAFDSNGDPTAGDPTGPQGPAGPASIVWKGAWATGDYLVNDAVSYTKQSYICTQNTTAQQNPADGAYWDILAEKGDDGMGTGDVVGPGSSTDTAIAIFNGTTGKLVKNSGVTIDASGKVDGRDIAADGAVLDVAIRDTDFAGSDFGRMTRTGAGAYAIVKDNLAASVPPTVSDDSSAGYGVGSMWIDGTNNKVYQCTNVAVGAADWQELSPAAGGGVGDYEFIEKVTASANSSIVFAEGNLDAGYIYTIDFPNFEISASGNVVARVQLGTGAGPTYATTGYSSQNLTWVGAATYSEAETTTGIALIEGQGVNANEPCAGRIELYDPGASTKTTVIGQGMLSNAGNVSRYLVSGIRNTAEINTGIKIIAAGTRTFIGDFYLSRKKLL